MRYPHDVPLEGSQDTGEFLLEGVGGIVGWGASGCGVWIVLVGGGGVVGHC